MTDQPQPITNQLQQSAPPSPSKLDSLSQNIDTLTKQLQKRQLARKQKKIKKRDQLNDLYDAIQQKSNSIVSKIEDLNRKPTITLSLLRILPQIPQGFPKNYNIQIIYEDVSITGNQKFIDFDQNIVDERFILPLLSSQNIRIQIWVAEEQPSQYDRCVVNLEHDIAAAVEDPEYDNQIAFQGNSSLSISYRVQLQGIGFNAWLKNVRSMREAEEEIKRTKKQTEAKSNKNREKIQEKKNKFNSKFKESQTANLKTKQYNLKGIQQILDSLDD